jgi:hypothetical protein
MRITKFVFAAALAVLPASGLQAQYFSNASAPNTDNTPFWDVKSMDDGQGCNIGYVLSGTMAACQNVKLSGDYVAPYDANMTGAWFAHSNGNVNSSVGFGFFGAGAQLKYFGGIAGSSPLSSLAVRDVSSGTVLHVFTTSARTYTFAGSGLFDIGIAMYNPASPVPNFFSWVSAKPNQFAVFGNGATGFDSANCGDACWVGSEDMLSPTDYDYNDGVLRITGATATVVPEPSTYVLMASGLLGLAAVARRRKNNA